MFRICSVSNRSIFIYFFPLCISDTF